MDIILAHVALHELALLMKDGRVDARVDPRRSPAAHGHVPEPRRHVADLGGHVARCFTTNIVHYQSLNALLGVSHGRDRLVEIEFIMCIRLLLLVKVDGDISVVRLSSNRLLRAGADGRALWVLLGAPLENSVSLRTKSPVELLFFL